MSRHDETVKPVTPCGGPGTGTGRRSRAPASGAGFTVMELVVTSFLGLLVVGLALSSVITGRDALGRDIVRTRLNQSIRGALEIIGSDVRIAGENLPSAFPSVLVRPGVADAPDELFVRRSLLPDRSRLSLCVSVSAGSSSDLIYVALASTGYNPCLQGPALAAQIAEYSAFRAAAGGRTELYVFDSTTRRGEFVKYSGEGTDGAGTFLRRAPGSPAWTNSYSVGSTNVFVLEEWRYRLRDGRLEVVQNNDLANPLNLAFDITDFQVDVTRDDGSVVTSLAETDDWRRTANVGVTVAGTERFRGSPIRRTLTAKYFPRNILSM